MAFRLPWQPKTKAYQQPLYLIHSRDMLAPYMHKNIMSEFCIVGATGQEVRQSLKLLPQKWPKARLVISLNFHK